MIAKTVQENILRLASETMERTMPEVVQKGHRNVGIYTHGYLRSLADLAYSEQEPRLAREIEIMITDLRNAWVSAGER